MLTQQPKSEIRVGFTTGYEALIAANPVLRAQVEMGTYSTYTPYKPTDLEKDCTKELLDGWKERWGTCPTCFTLRSAAGTCNC